MVWGNGGVILGRMQSGDETVKLLVFSDTHVREIEKLHPVIKESFDEADWVAHCGDFTGVRLLEGLIERFPRFVGVHGNSDPDPVRAIVPADNSFTIGRWSIGMTHPWWGMEPDGIEEKLYQDMGHHDIILFGHIHERVERRVNGTLIVNPGPGYPEFMTPGSCALLTLSPDSVDVEFRIFDR